eukprot:gene11025-12017_t
MKNDIILCVLLILLVVSLVSSFQPSGGKLIGANISLQSSGKLFAAQPSKNNIFSFFTSQKSSPAQPQKPKFPTLTVPPNYNVALGCLAIAGVCAVTKNYGAAVPLGFIGSFLYVQTGKIRFLFDDEAIEVVVSKKAESGEEKLSQTRENFAVGGRNRWKYNTITDWFFIPSKEFPVLVYFNENQTSPKGQIHFFPVLMNGKTLYETMVERIGVKRP